MTFTRERGSGLERPFAAAKEEAALGDEHS